MAERKTVAVCSLKGGVGRSLVSTALALAYARRGKRVMLLDLDRCGHAPDFFLGLQDRRIFCADDILAGRPADKTVLTPEGIPNLFLCPGTEQGRVFESREVLQLLDGICATVPFDVAILDTGSLADGEEFYEAAADVFLVVSTQQPAALLAAEKTAALLGENVQRYLLLNCFDLEDPSSYRKDRMGVHEMIDLVGLPLAGIVPFSYDLFRRSEHGTLACYEQQADCPFDNLAARLEGERRLLFEGMKDGKTLRRGLSQ